MSEKEEKFKLNLKKEVSDKFDCSYDWNAKVLLSNGQQKFINDLSAKEIENELSLGKLKGVFEPKKVTEPKGTAK